METVTSPTGVARRPRAFVGVKGPHAAEYLQRMVSNDVVALAPGESCDALLLTAKARVIATMRVVRRGESDYLLLTEPELGETVRENLLRMRFAARCEIELERHESYVRLGSAPDSGLAVRSPDYGVEAYEVIGAAAPEGEPELGDEALERLRIEAGTPLYGREIDERTLPAEAGLDERAISFTKGCYPGQEPVARLHYRGHANRSLRVLRIESPEPPERDTPISYEGKDVGRVTSAVSADGAVLALGYIRTAVPDGATLAVGGAPATMSRSRP